MEKSKIKASSPMILAMKGHPGTGKSTLARAIAAALRCPLVDKDDVRDCTATLQHTLTLTSPVTPSLSLLNDLSYAVIWRIAATQLRLGLSVILDSPLSRRSHLDRLAALADGAGARLFIIECRPSDESEWRRRVEGRGEGRGDGTSWHKPSTWQDMERLLEEYGGCTEYDAGEVPRIVVDTTASVGVGELVSRVMDLIAVRGGCTTD